MRAFSQRSILCEMCGGFGERGSGDFTYSSIYLVNNKKEEFNTMRKKGLLKRIVAVATASAMLFSMPIAMNPNEAKAAAN